MHYNGGHLLERRIFKDAKGTVSSIVGIALILTESLSSHPDSGSEERGHNERGESMTIQNLIHILSSLFGVLAAIFFCRGTLGLDNEDIASLSATLWGANPKTARNLFRQKSDYTKGSLFLLLSFSVGLIRYALPATFLIPKMTGVMLWIALVLPIVVSLFVFLQPKDRNDQRT